MNTVYGLLPITILLFGVIDRRIRPKWTNLILVAFLGLSCWLPWLVWNSQVSDNNRQQQEFELNTLVFFNYPVLAGTYWWPLTDMGALEHERDRAKRFNKRQIESLHASTLEEQLSEVRENLLSKILERPFAYIALVFNRALILLVSPPVGSTLLGQVHSSLNLLAFWVNVIFGFGAILYLGSPYCQHTSSFPFVGTLIYLLLVFGNLHSIRR